MERVLEASALAVSHIQARIEAALERTGRPAGTVALMAAVKTRTMEEISAVLRAGVRLLGENRVQEGLSHLEAMPPEVRGTFEAHFIGRLQTNKARKAVAAFGSIDSVDSLRLAQILSGLCEEVGLVRDVMLEVNLGEEGQKGGVPPEETETLAAAVTRLPGLRLTGLMGVCPLSEDPEASRPYYRQLAALFGQIRSGHRNLAGFRYLSMGMSHDFEIAVEEGATLVRVGQALFGPRRPA